MKRPLDTMHLQIVRRIANGSKITPLASPGMWRFTRGRVMYSIDLLLELREIGYITEDNQLTASGLLWKLTND